GPLGKKPPAGPERASNLRFDRTERLLVALLQVGARLAHERRQRPQPYAMPKVEVKAEQAIRDMFAGSEKDVKFVDGAAQIHRVLGRQKSPNDGGAVRRKVFSRLRHSRSPALLRLQSAYHHRIGNCAVRDGRVARRAAT